MKSGNATIELPDSLMRAFVYYPEPEEIEAILKDAAAEFVAIDSINTNIPKQIRVGEKLDLLASVTPFEATNRRITWKVENAIIDSLGRVITFDKAGTAEITATIKNGKTATEDYIETWRVQVIGSDVFVQVLEIRIDSTKNMRLALGKRMSFSELEFSYGLEVLPETATNKKIKWSAQGAVVDATGFLFNTPGTVLLTATIEGGLPASGTANDSGNFVSWLTFEVFDTSGTSGNDTGFVAVRDISADIPQTIQTGGEIILSSAAVFPANATNQKIVWSVSHPEFAQVVNNEKILVSTVAPTGGVLTVIADIEYGISETMISSSQSPNFSKTWQVAITQSGGGIDTTGTGKDTGFVAVRDISADIPQTIQTGGEIVLSRAAVLPANATNKKIVWRVSHPEFAQVVNNEKILVSTVAPTGGVLTVIAEIEYGISETMISSSQSPHFSKTWQVTIAQSGTQFIPVDSISLPTTIHMQIAQQQAQIGSRMSLQPIVIPQDATYQTIEWSVSGATIDGTGMQLVVLFDRAGQAIITATISDGIYNSNGSGYAKYTKSWSINVTAGGSSGGGTM